MKVPHGRTEVIKEGKHRHPRKKFSDEEDQKLIMLVAQFGDKNWTTIAKAMNNGRNTRQCRERYKTYLSPTLSNGPWTLEEDTLLISLVHDLGQKWAEIAKKFKGRSDNNVKNRWYTYLKNKEVSPLSPTAQNVDVFEDVTDLTDLFEHYEDENVLDFQSDEQYSEPAY